MVVLILPLVRKDEKCRFWALGTLPAMLPPAAARFRAIARSLRGYRRDGAGRAPDRRVRLEAARGPERAGGVWSLLVAGMLLAHGVLGPLLLPFRAAQMQLFGAAHDRASAGIPGDRKVLDRIVVVVAAPSYCLRITFRPNARSQACQARSSVPFGERKLRARDSRASESTLEIEPARGFLETPLDRHYRARASHGRRQSVALTGMVAEIGRKRAGRAPQSASHFHSRCPPNATASWSGKMGASFRSSSPRSARA